MSLKMYELRSDALEVLICPEEGGRVASLRSRQTGVEFLAQSRRAGTQLEASLQRRFQDGPAAGIEECLPTVGPSGDDTTGGAVPDHGDFWQLVWTVVQFTDASLVLEAEGFSRPLRFRKEFSLAASALSIRYTVTNVGAHDVSLLYACHPLLQVDVADRVCLADGVSGLSLNYSRGERLGSKGTSVKWPLSDSGIALDEVMSAQTEFAEMLYSGRLTHGACGIYRGLLEQGLAIRFDPGELPYLGIWLCYGGWPESIELPRQYAVALEPTFAPVNSLKEAQDAGQAKCLGSGESSAWSIAFELSKPQLSLDDFRAWVFGRTA